MRGPGGLEEAGRSPAPRREPLTGHRYPGLGLREGLAAEDDGGRRCRLLVGSVEDRVVVVVPVGPPDHPPVRTPPRTPGTTSPIPGKVIPVSDLYEIVRDPPTDKHPHSRPQERKGVTNP